MPWYQALAIIVAAGLSILMLTRPDSNSRPIAVTMLVGTLVLLTFGLATKEFGVAISVASWLSSG